MRQRCALLAAIVLVAPSAHAQTIDRWSLKIFNVGATAPLSTTDLLAANVVCNQAPPPPGPSINPTRVVFDDPLIAGRACIWTDTGTGPLFAVPFGGSYEATLVAVAGVLVSLESNRAPFTRPGQTPGVPQGLRLARFGPRCSSSTASGFRSWCATRGEL